MPRSPRRPRQLKFEILEDRITPTISAINSTVSFASSTDMSGVADTATIVVEDTTGTAVSGLTTSDFSFSVSGGTSTGSFGSVTETATPGTYTADFTGDVAGSADTLTLVIDTVTLVDQPPVTVTFGSVDAGNSTVSFASPTDTSGTTDTVTIVAEDAVGNAISGLNTSDFSFSLAGGVSTGSFGTVTETSTPGTYTANFTGSTVGSPSTLTLQIDTISLNSQPMVQVTPGVDAGNSTVSFASPTDASGTTDLATIVVEDAGGNPISGLNTSDFSFGLAGASTGSFGTVTETATPGTYTANFTGDIAGTASTLTLQIGGVTLNSQPTIQVTPGVVDAGNSTVSFASSTDASGTTDAVTIVVKDAAGNAITGLPNGAFSFSLAAGTSTGSFGTVTETSTLGTYTSDFTGSQAGTADTLTLQVSTVSLTSQPTIQVTTGSVDAGNSTVSFASSTDASGTTDIATIVVKDAAGNAITGLANGAFSFSLAVGTSTGSFGTVTATATPGTYTANFTGDIAGTASTLTLQISGVTLTSQPTIQVTPGSVDAGNSTVSFASSTDASGTIDAVTIVVKDAAGNAITGLANGAFSFSLSGGTSAGPFGTVTETATPGTYTANFTGVTAGTADTLTLHVSGVQLTTQPTIQVTPGLVSAGNSTVSFATSTDASGTTDTATIVVEDAAGNAITGLANGAFGFTLAGGTSTGSFGTVTETATPGTYTANFTGVTAGTADTLTLSVSSVQLTSQPTIQVTPGSVSAGNSTVSFTSSTDASGSSDTATIVVKDAAGNAITGLINNAFNLSLSGGTSTGMFSPVAGTATPGTYTATFTGIFAGTADTLTLHVSGVQLTSQPTIQVIPGVVDAGNSTVSFTSSTDVSGTTDTATIVVKDAVGNAITGLANGAFSFSLSGGTSTGSFGTVTETATPGTYTTNFTGDIAGSTDTLTLNVSSVQLTSQPTIQVIPSTVDATNSTVSFANSTDVSGTTDIVTIVVKDAAGNAITGLANNAFNFGLSGGASTGSFGTVTETATPGTYTTNFTGDIAGSASSLILHVGGIQLTSQPTIRVTPGSIGAGTSTVSFANSTDVSETTDTVTIVVEDAAGNAITGLANGAFSFSLAGGTSTGSFGTVTETATPGTYTTNFTGVLAGTADTLTLNVGGVQLTSQPTIQVIANAVDAGNSTVSFANSTDVSGTTDIATIVVKDAVGNAITGLTNSAFSFSLSGGTSTGSFGTVTETATPGTYTANFTGAIAGSAATLTLDVGGVQLTTQPQVTVTVGSVGAGTSTVSFGSSTDVSGTTDAVTIVVEDAAGNAISGLANNAFVFSLAGGTSTGSFGAVTETATPGTYTANFTGALAGSADTLTLHVGGVQLTTQPQVTVIPGTVGAGQTTVSFATPTLISGKSDILTIAVKDAAGNVISGLTSNDFTFSLSGGESNGGFGTVTETATPGTYTTVFTGIITGTASSLETIIDAIPVNATPTVQVNTGPLSGSNSSVAFATPTAAAGAVDTVTVVLEDAEGNPITGLPSKDFVFTLTGGTSTGKVGAVSETAIPGTYTADFTGAVAGTAKTLALKVNGISIATHPTVQVTAGAVSAAKTTVSITSPSVLSGKTDQVVIAVKDAGGNAIKGLTTSDFVFSLAGGTSTGTFGNVTVKAAATPGIYTVAFTGITAGTASTLTVAIDNTTIAAHPKVTVHHGAVSASTSSATFANATVASGTTDTLTLVVADAAGNPIAGLTRAAFVLTLSGGKSTGTFGPLVATATPGTYTIAFTGLTAGTPSTLTVKLNGVQLTTQPAVQVTPGAVNHAKSTITFAQPSVATGSTDTVTILVKDAAGNAITGLINSEFGFTLLGGTSAGSFGTVTETATPGTYTAVFTGVTAGSASSVLLAIDNVLLDEQPKVKVTA